jgi:hypothetical protein
MTNKVRSPRSHSLKAQTVSPDAIVLDAYFGRHVAPEVLLDAYEQLRIRDEPSDYTRLQAAVAAVLLRSIRHLLPAHSSTFDSDNRRRLPRSWNRLVFKPRGLFEINWADSALAARGRSSTRSTPTWPVSGGRSIGLFEERPDVLAPMSLGDIHHFPKRFPLREVRFISIVVNATAVIDDTGSFVLSLQNLFFDANRKFPSPTTAI